MGVIRFEESRGEDGPAVRGCGCPHCAARVRRARSTGRAGSAPVRRVAPAVRGTWLAAVVLASVGAVGLGLPAGAAHAEVAPSRPGWDGSRYWFRNEVGEWRYTRFKGVYLSRTSGRPAGTGVERAIGYALAQLGKPYVWGGDGPSGYDCSGLVRQAYQRAGIALPRVADDQYAATTPVRADRLRRGDLLFWSRNGRASGIHHVAIYLGGHRYVEAPHPGSAVRIANLREGFLPTHLGRP
ncbi:C40 family peptidase [Kitasatospora sp. NPDC052896]|uniref:C40 family peptidase n=1 Tax=Kitasatospora sp. NPDC052896 TaxID=3364061 RepID=UPI0037C9F7C1